MARRMIWEKVSAAYRLDAVGRLFSSTCNYEHDPTAKQPKIARKQTSGGKKNRRKVTACVRLLDNAASTMSVFLAGAGVQLSLVCHREIYNHVGTYQLYT